jgi:hypothetical protein
MTFLTAGCTWVSPDFATVDYYDYGAGIPAHRQLDPYPVKLLVEDLRPEILTRQKTPLYVGRAENGIGEARDVLNRDDCPVPISVHRTPHCRSLAESIRHRLKSAHTAPTPEDAKALVLVEVREWATHAGADLRLDYALDVYLRASSGAPLGHARIASQGEVIDTENLGKMNFANHEAKTHQLSLIITHVLDAKLAQLLEGPFNEALERLR